MMNLLDDVADYNLEDSSLTPFRNLKQWYKRWEDDILTSNRAPKTISTYRHAIQSFLNFSKKHRKIPISLIGAKYINRYLIDYQIYLAKKKCSAEDVLLLESQSKKKSLGKNDANFTVLDKFENTLSQRVNILKDFLKYITANNKEQHDYTKFFSSVANIVIHEKETPHLTKEELIMVIEYMTCWIDIYKDHKPKSSLRYAYRDAMLLILYAITGARGDEVVYIKLKDIKEISTKGREGYAIKLTKTKNGKPRSVGVRKSYLEKFIKYFKEELPSDDYYISSTRRKGIYTNKPMGADTLRTFSNEILTYLDINKKGLHAFRRGFTTSMVMDENMSIAKVAKMIGNSTATCEKYYLKHAVSID